MLCACREADSALSRKSIDRFNLLFGIPYPDDISDHRIWKTWNSVSAWSSFPCRLYDSAFNHHRCSSWFSAPDGTRCEPYDLPRSSSSFRSVRWSLNVRRVDPCTIVFPKNPYVTDRTAAVHPSVNRVIPEVRSARRAGRLGSNSREIGRRCRRRSAGKGRDREGRPE